MSDQPFQFEPEAYEALLRDKAARVYGRFEPLQVPEPEIFASPPSAFRMRAEFRMWHDGDALDYVMFRRGEPRTPVKITGFPIACEAIQQLMPKLKDHLVADDELRRKLFQVEFLSTLAGDTLVSLIYHRPLDERWEQRSGDLAESLGITIVGRSRKQKLVVGSDYVTECLDIAGKSYRYRQYEQAFTQPNAKVNIHMIEWALGASAALSDDLLELYCGNGNFTLPLASQFDNVIATELSKTSTRAAQHNLSDNDVTNVQMIRLAAEEVSQALTGVRPFRRLAVLPKPLQDYALNTVFVDPPRAGLDDNTVAMLRGFNNLIYISCNPETLASNCESLSDTHRITRFAMFDQFPYTDHMECGAMLERISA